MAQPSVVILMCSRGRETYLLRSLSDLHASFGPIFDTLNLHYQVVVYAQGYTPNLGFRLGLTAWSELQVVQTNDQHETMGEVLIAAVQAAPDISHAKLVLLIDDDISMYPDVRANRNLASALKSFLESNALCYSIKLGPSFVLQSEALVDPLCPFMPHKEKMMWVQPQVLDRALELPKFKDLCVGEDVVLAATAWQLDPKACRSVYGLGNLFHMNFESHLSGEPPAAIPGGWAALPPGTVHPYDIYPDLFVPRNHPWYVRNGLRPEAVAHTLRAGTLIGPFDLEV